MDRVLPTDKTAASDSPPADVLVIGLGNPILGDDGVGWRVAEDVRVLVGREARIEVECLAVGGLSLMERMLGYSRVILVDSIETGASLEGTVSAFSLEDLSNPTLGHSSSAHDAPLGIALETAKAMGGAIPRRVDIVAIETRRSHDFSEHLSPRIAAAVPIAARRVMDLLEA
ncbi:MAG: hydrogenase maturation protease [Chloroflexota bacterium]